MNLKDLPQPLPGHLSVNIVAAARAEAARRRTSVGRGADTSGLDAALAERFGWSSAKAPRTTGLESSRLQADVDRPAKEVDPDFQVHREARWVAPASLLLAGDSTRAGAGAGAST